MIRCQLQRFRLEKRSQQAHVGTDRGVHLADFWGQRQITWRLLKMKASLRMFTTLVALTTCSVCSSAKVFDLQHLPRNYQQLQNADSFSVECRNTRTGVIDRESVDVDLSIVRVEIPGSEPVVHRITQFSVGTREVEDRFGQRAMEYYLMLAEWGQLGGIGVGLMLPPDGRWGSHHEDDSWWTCAY